jgi:hypothetical protein
MAKIMVYRNYEFIDKDPVIDQVKSMVEKERLLKKPGIVHELSGVSRATIHNWFFGNTRRPQYATIMAVASSLGYQMGFKQATRIDVAAERKAAAKWRMAQMTKAQRAKERLIAQRKAARNGKELRA